MRLYSNIEINLFYTLLFAAFFIVFYCVSAIALVYLDLVIINYPYFTIQNSLSLIPPSIGLALGLLFFSKQKISLLVSIRFRDLLFAYLILLFPTLIMGFIFPWGEIGQEESLGHTFKSYFRHAYALLSFLILIFKTRWFFFLISLDVLFLFIDPSRAFFIESIFPKILFMTSGNFLKPKYFLFLFALLFILLYVQSFRLGNFSNLNFIYFAFYSDIMHSVYPAIQTFELSKNIFFPLLDAAFYSSIFLGEKFSPMGGFFLPAQFILSSNHLLNFLFSFFSTIFLGIIIFKGKYKFLFLIFSGFIFIILKFPLLNLMKLWIALFVLYYLVKFFLGLRVFELEKK